MRKNRTARAAAGGHSHLRTEMDSLGAVGVPADHLWGAQTQRCLADFQIGLDRFRWGRPVIRALGIVKKCAALANQETGCLVAKSVEYQGVVMMGRTHLQDAIPITLGQIASGWAAQLDRAIRDVRQTLTGLYELAVGATAVGTGLNAPADFAEAAARLIAAETGRPIVSAANKFAATSAHDAMVATSGSLRTYPTYVTCRRFSRRRVWVRIRP